MRQRFGACTTVCKLKFPQGLVDLRTRPDFAHHRLGQADRIVGIDEPGKRGKQVLLARYAGKLCINAGAVFDRETLGR